MRDFKLFIDDEWVDAIEEKRIEVIDPAKAEKIATVPAAGPKDVDRAVVAAKRAFESGVWSGLSSDERADLMLKAAAILRRRAPEFAEWETRTNGKPISESAEIDIPLSIRAMEYFANRARTIEGAVIDLPKVPHFDFVTYEPYGVVAVIPPWNYPLHLATRSLCAAMAAGNTVVLKPASLTPVTALLLGEVMVEAGIPAGVVNVISGLGSTAGEALTLHRDVSLISFTGSVEVGRQIMVNAAKSPIMKKVVLELGGKGPFIAERDCDIDGAVNSLIVGFCTNQGEVCCASTRLYLHEAIHDEFMEVLLRRVKMLRFGDTLDPATQMGSLTSEIQYRKVDGYVKAAVRSGAKLLCGGKRHISPPCERGYYYEPTILANVTNDMPCVREEIFGPVLVVQKYTNLAEAVKLANDNDYGLSATVWSESPRTLFAVARKLDAGTVWMNTNVRSRMEAPYGGNKNSGIGREYAMIGLKEYLKVKNTILYLAGEYENPYGFVDTLGPTGAKAPKV
ncbi:MAG: aldehyde dehydrogenase family protein [Rectinemataceae bacterium]